MRFERTTFRLGGGRSVLLSYGNIFFRQSALPKMHIAFPDKVVWLSVTLSRAS